MKMIKALIKTMRPRQWTKNLVLFAGIIFDGQLTNLPSLLQVSAAFITFCLVSGVIYAINDLMDMEEDQHHPKKKFRPLASGELSPKTAVVFCVILSIILLPSAFFLSINFGIVTSIYFFFMIAYSKWLKQIVIIDVLSIAAGFVLRMVAGIFVIKVAYFSPWLFLVTTLLALFLGFGKRRAELSLLNDNANEHRKVLDGYTVPLLDLLIVIVLTSTLITYSLYTFSASQLPQSHPMMFTIPFVLYGLFRYLYLIKVKNFGGAPEEVLLTDHPTQIAILSWTISVIMIIYIM
jgi:4-hydroxybenzoate polyprenyltransferase